MTQLLFILFCLLGYTLASAQTDYLVILTGDTIRGKVKYYNQDYEKKAHVKPENGKQIFYGIMDIRSFRIKNDMYYPVRTPQGYTFMKMLREGYLSLYAFQLPNQVTWDGRYFLKKDGNGMEVPNINFKKNLKRFLGDCPEVVKNLESGVLSKSKLNPIVDQYNACIDFNTKNVKPSQNSSQNDKIVTWINLETEVNKLEGFDQKTTVLEMISEVKSKISKNEKVPNFLVAGIKESLKDQPAIKEVLDKAVQELEK